MAKKSSKKTVNPETAISAADVGGPVDHHSQTSSWETTTSADELAETIAAMTTGEPEAPVMAPPATEFDAVIAGLDQSEVDAMTMKIAAAFDDRAAFEAAKNPDNTNIQRTLKKARAQMATKRAAKVMLATNCSADIINRVLHQGSRYNVYALGKLADVIYGVTDGKIANAINQACMKSLFRFRAAGEKFDGEMAKAAASDKIRITSALKNHLVRHSVSESTAPTQASSTMQALASLGVVKVSGTARLPVYELSNHPIVEKVEKVLAAA